MNINRRDKEKEASGYCRDNEPTLPSWGQVSLYQAMTSINGSEADAEVIALCSGTSLQPFWRGLDLVTFI